MSVTQNNDLVEKDRCVALSGCFTSRVSVELEPDIVLSPLISVNDSFDIGSMMMADPLIHQHGQCVIKLH